MNTSSQQPDWVRQRVYRRFGFDAVRFTILGHRGHYALLANPHFDRPYLVIDMDDGSTVGMYREPDEATARLEQLGGEDDD